MTNRTARTVPALLLAASMTAALAGCVYAPFAPAGPRVTDERDIEAVTAIMLETDGDVVVTLGDTPELTITAPNASMSRLTTEIVDGVLVLGAKGPGFDLGEVDYALTLPMISDISIDGSGDIDADFTGAADIRIIVDGSGDVSGTDIEAATVLTEISGSGDIELTGTADDLTLEIDGSGDFDGSDLVTGRARVAVNGSGDVEVNVTDDLEADISGSGEIRYTGGATVVSDVSGSGTISEDD